jgi:hypothetical protein
MHKDIRAYHRGLSTQDRAICDRLAEAIDKGLPKAESKVWHRHPVWFLDGNPIVGYSKLKDGVRLMFWSGASFKEAGLTRGTGKFKDASKTYVSDQEIKIGELKRWLSKSKSIQWDYKNIVKRRGKLIRVK